MLEKYEETLEFNRFGIISMLLIIVACLGGIAAGTVLHSTPSVVAVVVSCMLVEALILAVQPMKWIVTASVISVLLSILMILLG
jgi:uncharacterized membrane protein